MKNRITASSYAKLGMSGRIRQARELIGLSRADLAKRIGVGASAAVQWEHVNGTSPSVKHLIAIAQITDVSFEWLATGRGPARLGEPQQDPAVNPECFAQDLYEEQMLALSRQIPMRHRELLLRYLQTVYKG